MLTPFRRHSDKCPNREDGRSYKRCKCPIWIDGSLNNERVLCSAKTRVWGAAVEKCQTWQLQGFVGDKKPSGVSISEAVTNFKANLKSRGLRDSSIKKYRVLLDQLQAFCINRGVREIAQFDLLLCEQFRSSWVDGALSAKKKLERLRAFFAYLEGHGWTKNFPKLMALPIVRKCPTLPYTQDEMRRLLASADERMRALILLARYSGLRIGDAASCEKSRIVDGRLFLYTAKTGTAVSVQLPPAVIRALDDCPAKSQRYWFWTGSGSLDTLTGNMRRAFSRIAAKALVKNGHPHRLRDTFAVEHLNSGTSLEEVSSMLGHASIKVTQDHYSPWVKTRQDRLDAAVEKAHANDPLLMEQPEPGKLRRVK